MQHPVQHLVRSAAVIEAGVDGFEHFGKRCEVAVVRRQATGQFPNSLDRGELRAVWRQKQQPQVSSVAAQERGQEQCVVPPVSRYLSLE